MTDERGHTGAAFALIETMRWEGGFPLLRYHLARIMGSARCLGFPFDPDAFHALLARETAGLRGPHRVRLTLDRHGRLAVEVAPLDQRPAPWRLGFAAERLDPADPLRRHKTTLRAVYERALATGRAAGLDEVVMLNDAGAVAEGTHTNVVVERGGRLWTPPVEAGGLPGVYRAYLMDTAGLAERQLWPEDLRRADRLFVCNAVRGLVPAHLVD